jgi:hypothetical protein
MKIAAGYCALCAETLSNPRCERARIRRVGDPHLQSGEFVSAKPGDEIDLAHRCRKSSRHFTQGHRQVKRALS